MQNILKSKTFWTSIAAIAASGAGYAEGVLTTGAALQTVATGLVGIFLRMAMGKLSAQIADTAPTIEQPASAGTPAAGESA